jgi:tRNA nucleotidyltransferase (CCA-adding enzyme)
MDVITTHINADFDCLGALAAAARLYPGALLTFPGSQEKAVRDFISHHPDYLPQLTRSKQIDLDKITRLIIVDCQHAARIGRFGEIVNRPGLEIDIYDHHPPTEDSISATGGIIRPCGSVSTILAGVLMKKGILLTGEEATLMMLGIYEDTGRLLFQHTSQDDYQAAAWLLGQGGRLNIVADFISQELTAAQVDLMNTLLKNLKTTSINGINISISHASCDTYIADLATLAHIMRDMENLDALFLVVAMEKHVYIVGRSRINEVNTGDVLRRFNGGGHATAASAAVHDQPLKRVLQKLEERLLLEVRPRVSAGDIMSSPVKTIPVSLTVNEAREQLTRYNCNAMPVMLDEEMLGIISRKIVDKALYHELGESPVSDFMHTEFLRASTSTTISDIQEYMVEGNRRFVPVFNGEQLIGAVTRTDLLRHMYGGRRGQPEALYDLDTLACPVKNRNITGMVRKKLSSGILDLLNRLGGTGDTLGLQVYAVGGFVRDLLLGIDNFDLDVTVEGDGIFFAEKFAAENNGRVRSHKTFGTAVVVLPDGSKVDVASTRLEFYESPGVLPAVERSSLRHDLYRRDFTINTLAFCINNSRFGMLTDYFGGQQDLQERTIKVLHNLSFVEDPTRVFRAIRFEQRLGFHIATHTENLIRNAVRMNVLDKVGGKRLLSELIQIFNELKPENAINRMSALGLFPSIHPKLRLTQDSSRVLLEAGQLLAWFRLLYLNESCEQWQVYFLALTEGLKQDEFEQVCQRLSVPERMSSRVFSHRQRVKTVLEIMQRRLKRDNSIRNSEIYLLLKGLPMEMLLYLAAITKQEQIRRYISLYMTTLRNTRCELGGKALQELGLQNGPQFGLIMERILAARLDGLVKSIEEEKALALSLIKSW